MPVKNPDQDRQSHPQAVKYVGVGSTSSLWDPSMSFIETKHVAQTGGTVSASVSGPIFSLEI